MSPRTKTTHQWTLASVALRDAYTDFILSRQAMNCAPATLEFYEYTAGFFLAWIEPRGITSPHEVTARQIREYIAELVARGKKDTTVWDHARAIKTMLRFWHNEGYITTPIKFELPKIAKRRLPVLNAEQLQQIAKACNVRDKAIVLFMADSGLRRRETLERNWGDVDMQSGLVRVLKGKGGKDRSAVIGATVRRALLKYRRTLTEPNRQPNSPLFQTENGTRFTGSGIRSIFRRLRKKTGINITAHAMRRTFTILSLRAGMDSLHLQNLGGWESLDMVEHYAQLEDIDLLREHKAHSPVDNL